MEYQYIVGAPFEGESTADSPLALMDAGGEGDDSVIM